VLTLLLLAQPLQQRKVKPLHQMRVCKVSAQQLRALVIDLLEQLLLRLQLCKLASATFRCSVAVRGRGAVTFIAALAVSAATFPLRTRPVRTRARPVTVALSLPAIPIVVTGSLSSFLISWSVA
jgi:hypothetical protein